MAMTTGDGPPPTSAPTGGPSADSPNGRPAGVPQPPARRGLLRRRPPRKHAKPKPRRSFLRELPGIVVTALIISVLIKTFLVQAFYIPSGSMENTLLVNDRVLVNKLADKPDEVHRGDVVVFRDPGGWLGGPGDQVSDGGVAGALRKALVFVGLAPAAGEEDLIKRVIGVGGDHVVCCDASGRVTVNDVPLREPYLFHGDQPSAQEFDVKVLPGRLWVMGDHRSVSEDSRAHNDQPGTSGFVPVSDVIGRAFTIVWPVDRAHLLRIPQTFHQPALAGAAR
jgi:signal peptidase I